MKLNVFTYLMFPVYKFSKFVYEKYGNRHETIFFLFHCIIPIMFLVYGLFNWIGYMFNFLFMLLMMNVYYYKDHYKYLECFSDVDVLSDRVNWFHKWLYRRILGRQYCCLVYGGEDKFGRNVRGNYYQLCVNRMKKWKDR